MSDAIKEYFSIDKIKGVIETKAPLDREIYPFYDIPIIATDNGGRSGFATVKVKIVDENDNPPIFVLKEYHAMINSNLQVLVPFMKVKQKCSADLFNIFFYLFYNIGKSLGQR